MSNDEVIRYVTDELRWEPMVDSEAIAVSADDGEVTLRGTVGSFREKLQAKKAAERVFGVRKVDSRLQVRLMTESRRDDADLRGDVLRALALDALVPSTIDAQVEGGIVALSGTADKQFQRDEAMSVAGNVRGVVDVWDDIALTPPTPDPGDLRSAIEGAFARNAKLDANELSVTTSPGTVTLEGTVGSRAEHDDAVAAAWAAPGVRHVDDGIDVAY